MGSFDWVPKEIYTQCGLISLLLTIAVIFFAMRDIQREKKCEKERQYFISTILKATEASSIQQASNEKLQGMILMLQRAK